MSPLRRIWRLMRAAHPRAMWRGLALGVALALSGIALLALSGWFIVAAGIAGAAGLGAHFDVFRPSAGIRFLAMARTASRYGERLLTHDATLKALAALRVQLLDGLARADFARQSRLRGGEALNRLTADVDALDGLAIRLVFPALSGLVASVLTFAALWAWIALPVALWVVGLSLSGALAVLWWSGRAALGPAAHAEARHQALRAGAIDTLRGRAVLIVAGDLPQSEAALLTRDRAARAAGLRQARIEWRAQAMLQMLAVLVLAGALWLAGSLVLQGRIGAAQAGLAVFAALAMGELTGALQRGVAEIGRMRDAAARVAPLLDMPETPHIAPEPAEGLQLRGLSAAPLPGLPAVIRDLSLHVAPGETVALTGPSGCGKSALLNTVAGLVPAVAGQVRAGGRIGYLPQRPALIAGSLRDALALAAPEADDATMRAVLDHVALDLPLDLVLGEAGAGLSGGQARRLALARVLIQRPGILLLDEPTEGLDGATAARVLAGLRDWLPDAAILIAAHRAAEQQAAGRIVAL